MTTNHLPLLGSLALSVAATLPCQRATGRIVDVLGDPIPAASVQVVVDGKVIRKTYSDGFGIYLIPTLPADGANLRIGKPGKASTELTWRGHRTPTIRNVTLFDASRLHGCITDKAGQAMARAEVVAVFGNDSLRTQTDHDGYYVLDPVPLGRVTLSVCTGQGTAQQSLRMYGETECNLQVVASQGTHRQIHVHGLPRSFAGGYVSVVSSNMVLLSDGGSVPLAADGTASLRIQELSIVTPKLIGYVTEPRGRLASPGATALHFEARAADTEQALQPIKGEVRTLINKAVRDEPLYFHDQSGQLLGTARADRSGNFSIEVPKTANNMYRVGVALDRWELIEDERSLYDGHTWVRVYGHDDRLRLLVQPTGRMRGTIMDDQATLLPLADITIANARRRYHALVQTACDQGGHFDIALPEARYDILAVTHDGRVCQARLDIDSTRDTTEIQWQTIATGTASGVVKDSLGQPMPGIELFFAACEAQNQNGVYAAERQTVRAFTDRHGRFRCRGLPTGDWTVVARNAPEFGTTQLQVRAGTEVQLQITGK